MTLPPFEQVVAEHGSVVLRVCRALLDTVDADDAWSETFLSALKAYPDLRADSNVRGWLVTIAHRKALDRLRVRARQPIPSDSMPDQHSRVGQPATPDDALWRAVRALPDKQRGAVAYHYLADLPYVEVAALLGTSETAARRSASDGIARLRRTYPDSLTDPASPKESTR